MFACLLTSVSKNKNIYKFSCLPARVDVSFRLRTFFVCVIYLFIYYLLFYYYYYYLFIYYFFSVRLFLTTIILEGVLHLE